MDSSASQAASPPQEHSPFGETHVHPPTTAHTHTAIMIHGRGDLAASFAEDLLTSPLSTASYFPSDLPSWRFVFPAAPCVWSAVFQESMPSWFEAASLAEPSARQDLQASGLRRSVEHVRHILEQEIALLGGDRSRVVLGGISQGGAVGMWTLLSLDAGIGGVFGVSTWLPFAEEAQGGCSTGASGLSLGLMSTGRENRRTPIFMGHGVDDAYVDVALGREAAQVLRRVGFMVHSKEYTGAEQEGHWFKVPEGLDDLHDFLVRFTSL